LGRSGVRFTDVDAPNELEQAQIQQILLGCGVLTINEVRRMKGLPPLPSSVAASPTLLPCNRRLAFSALSPESGAGKAFPVAVGPARSRSICVCSCRVILSGSHRATCQVFGQLPTANCQLLSHKSGLKGTASAVPYQSFECRALALRLLGWKRFGFMRWLLIAFLRNP